MKIIYFVFLLLSLNMFAKKTEPNSKDSITFYIKQANFNYNRFNYKTALIFAQNAISLSEKTNNTLCKSKSYATIGNIYFKLRKYPDAIKSLQKSISTFISDQPIAEKASIYYLLGLCYLQEKNTKEAEINFNKADTIYKTQNNKYAREMLNLQKGIVYKSNGKLELARVLFEGILFESDDNNDEYKTKAEALYQIGTIECQFKKYDLALEYLNRALLINKKHLDPEQKSKILLAISVVYEKLNNKITSYNYLKNHLIIKDSIYNDINSKLEEEEYNQFKDSEHTKELQLQRKENDENEKNSKFSKLISILAIALISILSLLSLSLYKNNIIRNKNNETLKEKNDELIVAKEKVERAMKARSDFLSTVSHELRTPLNAINGITHLLLEENPNENQIEYLKSLKFSGNYLLTFINEILEANRIESNKVEIEYINFNLIELVSNIQNSLKEIAAENNNKVVQLLDNNIAENFIGDPTKISQILINLINNAIKFTTNGIVTIEIKTEAVETNFSIIKFSISDTGIGIPADKLDTIFESFSQGSIEINRTYGGTGLGLTIVKNLVEILGGKIVVESSIGKGSNFYFVLKLTHGNKKSLEKKTVNLELLIGKKLLLVEDNKINQMITRKMLESKKMTCDIVDNGEDAIEYVRKNKYDAILMDVHLPGINGTIATEQIREFDKETPIIALTAISLNENRETLLAFGMNDVLTKPFEPENFYRIIAKFV